VISTLVLARLLTPAEIGTFSIAAVLIGIVHVMRDFGVGQYVIQENDLTPERQRSALTVSMVISWGLALLMFVLSDTFASYYREPGLSDVLLILAFTFLILPLGAQAMSLLNRELNFRVLFYIKFAGTIMHAVVAIALAWLGHGFMSLAWAALANVAVSVGLAVWKRPQYMLLRPSVQEYRRVFSFGIKASFARIMSETGAAVPDLVVGRVLGLEAAGYFSRAMGTVSIFRQAVLAGINQISLPYFSAMERQGGDVNQAYLRVVSYITVLAWPFFCFVGLMAFPIVRIMYGEQWDAAIPIVQILAVYAMLDVLVVMLDHVLVSTGQVGRFARFEIITNAILVALVILAAPYGLEWVAAAMIGKAMFTSVVVLYVVKYWLKLSLWRYILNYFRSAAVTVLSIIVPVLVYCYGDINHLNYVQPLFWAGLGWVVAWGIGVYLFKHQIREELNKLISRYARRAG